MSLRTRYRAISRFVREAAVKQGKPYPIIVRDGSTSPRLCGRSYHWTNRSGDFVFRPSAYARRGWSSLVYHRSTLRIEVGILWLLSHGLISSAQSEMPEQGLELSDYLVRQSLPTDLDIDWRPTETIAEDYYA
jgi:hypothetical protein